MAIDKSKAIRFCGLAINFWRLTLNVAEELIKQKNPGFMSFPGWELPSNEEIDEHFKWSDSDIIEPTLFSFYHGIELGLKSLVMVKRGDVDSQHRLSDLLKTAKELYGDDEIFEFYEKYIHLSGGPQILSDFCFASRVTMDLYFQSLKYPTSTKGVDFIHAVLRAQEMEGVKLFEELAKDLRAARSELQKFVIRELGDEDE